MNKLDLDYQRLLRDILKNGVAKLDRTGTGTLSVFGRQIRHSMADGFPLLTTKKMAWKSIVTELLWFLRGDTNIKYLIDNDCHIWDGDAYKNYLNDHALDTDYYTKEEFVDKIKTDDEFAKKWGDLGRVYGAQWRNWASEVPFGEATSSLDRGTDQITNLINGLMNDPDSRRLLVTAWNPADVPNSVLPPYHIGFQLYTRELSQSERFNWYGNKIGSHMHHDHIEQEMDEWGVPKRAISLTFNMRSTDVGLGLPFNLASYGLLLMMIAKQVNMVPDELIYNGEDVHIYSTHIEPIKEQLDRNSHQLPTVEIHGKVEDIAHYEINDISLKNYQHHPAIKLPLSN